MNKIYKKISAEEGKDIAFGTWLLNNNPQIVDKNDYPLQYKFKDNWPTMYELYCIFEEDELGMKNGINEYFNKISKEAEA